MTKIYRWLVEPVEADKLVWVIPVGMISSFVFTCVLALYVKLFQ